MDLLVGRVVLLVGWVIPLVGWVVLWGWVELTRVPWSDDKSLAG